MPVKILTGLLFGVSVLLSWPAQGAPIVCAPRSDVLSQLGDKYLEAPVAAGLEGSGGLMELFRSVDGSTWTLVLSMPDGRSCLVAAGEDWQDHTGVVFPMFHGGGDPL